MDSNLFNQAANGFYQQQPRHSPHAPTPRPLESQHGHTHAHPHHVHHGLQQYASTSHAAQGSPERHAPNHRVDDLNVPDMFDPARERGTERGGAEQRDNEQLPARDPSPSTPGTRKAGRPRDKVWELFEGDRQLATCRYCGWRSDHPKAFRMRSHVQTCAVIPKAKKIEQLEHQEEKSRIKLVKQELAAETQANVSADVLAVVRANAEKKKRALESNGAGPGSLSGSPVAGPSDPKRARQDLIGDTSTSDPDLTTLLSAPHYPRMSSGPSTSAAPLAAPAPPARSPITCHVLDSTSGKPAPDMRVRLDRLNTTGFVLQGQGMTDKDGRCNSLLPATTKLEVGIFKITFFTSEYFTSRGILSFYPFVEIPFEVKSSEEHYHIPCLLSPYSYTTYRGS
ncbi:hypothetical protein JCM10212_000960 [Sporobolomyces blumeae]